SFPFTNGQLPCSVVPHEWDFGIDTVLIVVVIKLIFVKCESTICSCINLYFQIIPFLFRSGLYFWSQRNNTTCFDVYRYIVDRCLPSDFLAAIVFLVSPVVVPERPGRKINLCTL